MLGTYASAALICAASLLVGRALLSISGRRGWTWLEPAVGFGAIITVTGLLARVPGHGTAATLGALALVVGAVAICRRERYDAPAALRTGLPVAIAVALALTIPFLVSGRWGMIGVGFNNDLGFHLAWAEWLRSGFGHVPFAGYPLGPHGLAVAVAAVPGLTLGQDGGELGDVELAMRQDEQKPQPRALGTGAQTLEQILHDDLCLRMVAYINISLCGLQPCIAADRADVGPGK